MKQEDVPSRSVTHLSIKTLARELDTTPWTIRRWVKLGQFPKPIYFSNQSARWPLRVVEAFLLKQRTKRRHVQHQGAVKRRMQADDAR
jgi:hypothetical protein